MSKRIATMVFSSVLLVTGSAALAQPPQFPPPPGEFGQGQSGFGRGNRGGRGGPGEFGPMANRTVSIATLSLRTLSTYLGISDTQKGKIAQAREDAREAMPLSIGNPGVDRGIANPRRTGRATAGTQQSAAETQLARSLTALLTEEQRNRLTVLVQALQTLQNAGVRSEAAPKLQLTDEQLIKLAGLAGDATTDVVRVLTDEQATIAQQYQIPTQQPAFAGRPPDGPGGPPPGFDGPPPGVGQ